jgi:hypothetical protein
VVASPKDSSVSTKSKLQAGIVADALKAVPVQFVSAVRGMVTTGADPFTPVGDRGSSIRPFGRGEDVFQ